MPVGGFLKGGLSVGVATLALAFGPSALAANFQVTKSGDDGSAGTMRWAIEQLNAAGPGNHSITLNNSVNSISTDDDLPNIDGTGMTIVINGRGATLDGHDQHRLIFVNGGNVTLLNFNLKNGLAEGGQGGDGNGGGGGGGALGGALFVNDGAHVTLSNVNFDSNSAVGGNGGESLSSQGGGGGGGLGGDGGDATDRGGGGGGGFSSNGGDSHGTGGGGGGGIFGDGGNTSSSGGGGGGGILLPGGPAIGPLPGIGALTGGDGGAGIIGGNGGFGFFGGGGGGGEALFGNGGDGGAAGELSGGGGGGYSDNGGDGGSGIDLGGGGGGAAAGSTSGGVSGDGTFGGGGGGAPVNGTAGAGGYGAGDGGAATDGGDGGSGYGGAVFVREGGTLTIINSAITGNSVAAGDGGQGSTGNDGANGAAAGAGLYVHDHVTANLQVTAGKSYTYADSISGTGGISKTGTGTLTFSGQNTLDGNTEVLVGTLVVNGTHTSNTTIVSNNTRLGGNGTIVGDVVSGGTIAAGNSIGTLSIQGNFVANGSSHMEVEVNAGGTTPGVNVDLVDISGNAQLLGDVVVIAAPGTYNAGTQYTFLTATNVTGTFSGISDDFAFLDAVLGYTPSSAYFTLLNNSHNYADLGCTPNTYHVGLYLDAIAPTATGNLEDLLLALDQVSNDEACYALEQLTGAIYGSTGQIGVQNSTIYIQTLANRLRSGIGDGDRTLASDDSMTTDVVMVSYTSTKEHPLLIHDTYCSQSYWNTWATGFGLGGNASTDENAAGLQYSMGGTLAGVEAADQRHLVGLYTGYLYNYIGTDANESNRVNGGTFGGYYVTSYDRQYVLGIGGFEFDGFDSRRRISFAGLTAEGGTNGWKGYYYTESGITFGDQLLAVQPFAGLQYIYYRQNGFTETGAAAANLDVPGINTNSLRSVIGSRFFADNARLDGRNFTPEIRTLWLHEFLETDTGFNTFFSAVGSGGGSFAINGLGMGRDWAVLGAGLNCDLSCHWSAYTNYDLMLNDQTTFHIGSGGVEYVW